MGSTQETAGLSSTCVRAAKEIPSEIRADTLFRGTDPVARGPS